MKNWPLYLLVAAFGLGLGIAVAWFSRPVPPSIGLEGARVGDLRPPFRHASVDGQYLTAADFDGQPLLVNFWATWCAPCRREMPLLNDISQSYAGQLNVIGIAVDEPGPVVEFVNALGIEYPVLVGSSDVVATQRAWGNAAGALPYTVLIDDQGIIRWQHLGEVTKAELEPVLADWLASH